MIALARPVDGRDINAIQIPIQIQIADSIVIALARLVDGRDWWGWLLVQNGAAVIALARLVDGRDYLKVIPGADRRVIGLARLVDGRDSREE